MVFSEARNLAFGGFPDSIHGTDVRGMWDCEDIGQSSTFHELKAFYFVLPP